jgi:hypothetical protein
MTVGLLAHRGAQLIGRQDLRDLPTPPPTATHQPIPHARVVEALIETLGYRGLRVVTDQYALTPDSMRMFGVLALNVEESGIRFAIGLRNSHDKSYAFGLTVGYKVFVCDNLAFHGDYQPLTRKHSKNLVIEDVVAIGVERMQRNFAPMVRQVNAWREHELSDASAKLLIYQAFIESELDAPRRLSRIVHDQYFTPTQDEFQARTLWSLSNAFTSAFKELDPIPQYRATAGLARFLPSG